MPESESHRQSRHLLKKAGLRATAHRQTVLQSLLNAQTPLSVPEIHTRLRASSMNKVTLYRILDLLVEQHILHRHHDSSGHNYRYCAQQGDTPFHAHFFCNACKKTECVSISTSTFSQPDNFQIEHADIRIDGLCQQCLATGESEHTRYKTNDKLY